MPSTAYTGHLEPLLADAKALIQAHTHLSSGSLLPLAGLDALPRAVVVMCVSAWEAYVEEVVRLAVRVARPTSSPLGLWSALDSFVQKSADRFNTPNAENVRTLIANAIGLPDIRTAWSWIRYTPVRSSAELAAAMKFRHEIAHGVNPRPVVTHQYAVRLPDVFRCLGRCTDRAVRAHLVTHFGIPNPWPA
jgi:hypothetical protein